MILVGLDKTNPLVVGVSGGADSLALLHLLHEAGFSLVVCHFNHRLRPAADGDATFVESVAAKLRLPFEGGAEDVGAFAETNRLSVEEAARKLRYRFLYRCARSHGAQAVAVGHTADDQIETVLMHFIRGAGLSGLKGMLPRTILTEFDADVPLVRPILQMWRKDTEAYCGEHGLDFRSDASNTDPTYFRNRLRLSLIPELETYNPGFRAALLRSSGALQGDYELIQGVLDAAWERTAAEQGPGFLGFSRAALEELPIPLRRGLIRRGAFRLRPGLRDVDFDALEEAAAAITPPQASTRSRAGGLVEIAGGLRLEIEADTVFLTGQGIELPAGEWPQVTGDAAQTWKWETRGQIELAGGLVLEGEIRELDGSLETTLRQFLADATLKLGKMDEVRRAALPEFTAWLSADVAGEVLEIRTPQPGDRVEPLGMGGKRVKLSDLFINNRIPKRLRARWPLVCVGEQIAWVPGLRAAERFRLREKLPARVWRLVVRPEADQKQGVPRSAKGAKRKIRTSAEKADS